MSIPANDRSAFPARAAVRALAPYEGERTTCRVELADNTNAFGPAPTALETVRHARPELLARYPTSYSRALREAIAQYVGVSVHEIVVGCGSDDVLDCAYRTLAEPGGSVALLDPSFVMARVFAVTNGLRVIPVPLAPDGDLDADAVVDSGASVAYLCSPNNPTGNRLSRAAVDGVLARFPGLVMIDEAYAEFAGESRAADAPHHGRLLVLRTFSKAFGLAGLRVGYGVAAGHIILELEKVRGPYNVTSLGERAALAALQFDQPWVRATVAQTLSVRDRFVDALRAAGFAPRPSAANFVLVPVGDARAQASKLQARGIGIRPFSGLSGIGDALRITVGPWDVMDEVLAALQAVRSEA